MIDYLYESQIKNQDDEDYLTRDDEIHIPTFSSRRQKLRNEGCNIRMKDRVGPLAIFGKIRFCDNFKNIENLNR